MPFFPEVHEEFARPCSHLSARTRAKGNNLLFLVDGTDKWGYAQSPPFKEAIAAHLCPSCAWKSPSLPSKPCRTTAHISEKAYGVAGHAASALHTLAILQVFQTFPLSLYVNALARSKDSEVFALDTRPIAPLQGNSTIQSGFSIFEEREFPHSKKLDLYAANYYVQYQYAAVKLFLVLYSNARCTIFYYIFMSQWNRILFICALKIYS